MEENSSGYDLKILTLTRKIRIERPFYGKIHLQIKKLLNYFFILEQITAYKFAQE